MSTALRTDDRPRNRAERRRRSRHTGRGDLHLVDGDMSSDELRRYVRSLSSRELRRLAGRRNPGSVVAASAVSWALISGASGATPTAAEPGSPDPPSIAGVPRPATELPPLVLVIPDPASIPGFPTPADLGAAPVAAPAADTARAAPAPPVGPDPSSIAGLPRLPAGFTFAPVGPSAGQAPAPMPSLFPDPSSIAGLPRPTLDLTAAPSPEAEAAPSLPPFFVDPPSIAGNPRPSLFDAPVVTGPQPWEFFVGFGDGLGGEISVIWGPQWTDVQLSAMFGLYLGGKVGAEVAPERSPGISWEFKGSTTFFDVVKGEVGVTAPAELDALYGVAKGGVGPIYLGGRWELAPDFQFIDDRLGRQTSIGPRIGLAGAAGLRATSERHNLYDDFTWLWNEALRQLGLAPPDPNAAAPTAAPDPNTAAPDPNATPDPNTAAPDPNATPDPTATPDPNASAPPSGGPDPASGAPPAEDPAPAPDPASATADPAATTADPAPAPDPAAGSGAPAAEDPAATTADPAPAPDPAAVSEVPVGEPLGSGATPALDPAAADVPVDTSALASPEAVAVSEPASYTPIAFDNPSTTMDGAGASYDPAATASYAPTVDTTTYADYSASASTSSYSSPFDSAGGDAAYEPYAPDAMASLDPIAPLDIAPLGGRESYDPMGGDSGLGGYDSGFDSGFDSNSSGFDSGGGFSSGGE